MNSAFLKAAASYYGINPDQLSDSYWRNDGCEPGGQLVVTFEVAVTEYDAYAIMARMKEMRQASVFHVEQPKREVRHVDVPEVEDTSKPEVVWVDEQDMTDQQKMMASDSRVGCGGASYLLQVVMLTPEQRARYVPTGEHHG